MKRYTNEQMVEAVRYIVENIEALNKALDDALRAKRKERLEIIKFLRESEKVVAPGMQPSELISRKDVDWLINSVEDLEKQNERYREALEAIAYFDDKEEGETTTRIDAKYIARKALEGEE